MYQWADTERIVLGLRDRKSTRLNSSHGYISYAVFCLKKKKHNDTTFQSAIHLQIGRTRSSLTHSITPARTRSNPKPVSVCSPSSGTLIIRAGDSRAHV